MKFLPVSTLFIASLLGSLSLRADPAADLSAQANAAEKAGRTEEAIQIWQSLVQQVPGGNASTVVEGTQFYHYRLGLLLQKEGKLREAEQAHRRSVSGNWVRFFDDPAIPLRDYAEVKVKRHDYKAAVEVAGQALAFPPKTDRIKAFVLRTRAVAHFLAGYQLAATTDWTAARLANPAWSVAPFEEAQIPFNAAIAAQPQDPAGWLARANYFLERFHAGKALAQRDLSSSILDGKPASPAPDDDNRLLGGGTRLLTSTGGGFSYLTALDDAEADATQMINTAPQNPEAWLLRVRVRQLKLAHEIGKQAETRQRIENDLNRAVAAEPRHAGARLARAEFWLDEIRGGKLTDPEKAERLGWANFDLSHVNLTRPSARAHLVRARLERTKPRPDEYTVTYSAEQALALAGPGSDATSLAPAERIELLLLAAQGKVTAGQTTEAAGLYRTAMTLGAEIDHAITRQAPYRLLSLLVETGDYAAASRVADEPELTMLAATDAKAAQQIQLFRAATLDGLNRVADARAIVAALQEAGGSTQAFAGTRLDPAAPTEKPFARVTRPKDTLARRPEGTPVGWKEQGNKLFAEGKHDPALACYTHALTLDPAYADALCNRGGVYVRQHKLDLAMSELNRAIALQPTHAIAHFNLAQAWEAASEYTRTLESLDRAEASASNDGTRAAIFGAKAHAHYALRNFSATLTEADRAIALAPTSRLYRFRSSSQFASLQFEDAVRSAAEAERLEPTPKSKLWLTAIAAVSVPGEHPHEASMQAMLPLVETAPKADLHALRAEFLVINEAYQLRQKNGDDTQVLKEAIVRLKVVTDALERMLQSNSN